ncbi:MAG: CAP domain-containing protein [Candidatus Thiothrix sulfatifontis]|nr:MAG: CAP domain-containing protein [Candidatus Thiothrix sulfatifontis]
MSVFRRFKAFAILVITSTVLLSACQEEGGQSSYQALAKATEQSASPLLGDALTYPGLQPHHISDEPEQAWRVPASNTGGWAIDSTNRQLARAFYNSVYLASNDTPIAWTGNHSSCAPGTTSSEFKNSVLARINYFRAMAGVPANITLNATFNAKAQQAALMMSTNNSLSHTPPSTWNCYTTDGYTAAGSSNISLGHNAWNAVDGQMRDNGTNNTVVGHRRWLLHPQTQTMGTGDVPAIGSFSAANAIWVFDGNAYNSRPTTRDTFVAWPTKGFNPYQVVPVRWSFAYPGANFTNATVSMTQSGTAIPVALETVANGYGENTLVWRPNNMTANQDWPKPAADTHYQVSVNNVIVGGSPRNFTYTVTVFDPQTAGSGEERPAVNGSTSPPANTPATYAFNSVSFAQQYEAYIAEIAAATGVYNAETGSLSVTDGTDSSYTLVYSGSGSNGTNVYRLAPATASETVEFPITYVPSSNSTLRFDSKLGYATNGQTAAIQISLDGGASWQDIYSKTGTNSGSVEETDFSTKSISLSAYANKVVKFRAQYRHTGYRYLGTSTNVSFLVDNVQIMNAQQIVTANIQNTGSNTSFSFTPISGKRYALTARVIPWVGYPGLTRPLLYSEASTAVDTQPNAFSFSAQTAVARSTVITSNAITVSGINTGAAINVSGGSYSINNGAFTSVAGLVNNGNTVRVQHTSAANYASNTNTKLTIGGISGIFTSTTLPTSATHALTVTKAGTGSGTVTSAPAGINCGTDCNELYANGTAVSLTARATTGSKFTGWSGGICSGTGTCNVSMTAAKSVTANFTKAYTLTVAKAGTGAGTVTSAPAGINCGTDCNELYANGTAVSLTARATTGSKFTGWSGGVCSGTGTCNVSMTAAKSVTANFTKAYTLTVAKAGTGAGTVTSAPAGINCGTDCNELYANGTAVSLTARATTGSKFTGWSGGVCSGTGTCNVSMTAAKSVTANFTKAYTLTVAKAGTGAGTVTSAPAGINCGTDCNELYASGTPVTLNHRAATGSRFTGWSGACTGVSSCNVTMTKANTVVANFVKP